MNRLAPLIVRRPRPAATNGASYAPAAVAAEPAPSDDVRLFLTNFLGGLAFFGTYLA
jgi:hypothetical protein